MNKTILQFAMAGFVSGVLSYLLSVYVFDDSRFTAGAVFGVVMAVYLIFCQELRFSLPTILWVFSSTASYYAAVWVAIHVVNKLEYSDQSPVPFFIGGVVGAALMLAAFHFFLKKLTINSYFGLVLLGGILGPSALVNGGSGSLPLFVLCVVWQTGMFLGLGYVANKNQ